MVVEVSAYLAPAEVEEEGLEHTECFNLSQMVFSVVEVKDLCMLLKFINNILVKISLLQTLETLATGRCITTYRDDSQMSLYICLLLYVIAPVGPLLKESANLFVYLQELTSCL